MGFIENYLHKLQKHFPQQQYLQVQLQCFVNMKKDKKCRNKYRFKHYQEAFNFAKEYMEQVAMTFYPMVPYWCKRHDLWHIGHDSFKKQEYNVDRILSDRNGENVL